MKINLFFCLFLLVVVYYLPQQINYNFQHHEKMYMILRKNHLMFLDVLIFLLHHLILVPK